jgi:hypothetical protein
MHWLNEPKDLAPGTGHGREGTPPPVELTARKPLADSIAKFHMLLLLSPAGEHYYSR